MRMKSYNRLPRPILRFVAYLAALIAVAALVLPPVVKEVRGDFARVARNRRRAPSGSRRAPRGTARHAGPVCGGALPLGLVPLSRRRLAR